MKYTIYNKSCEDMEDLGNETIASIFTSPPYALAKDYGKTSGIGMSENTDAYKEYLNRMFNVFKECYRVLQSGRYIGVNIADVIQTDKKGSEKKPIRYHFFTLLRKCGFIYTDTICWKKPDGMGTQKRFGVLIQNPYPMYYHPNNIYEPILVFRKPGRFELSDYYKDKNTLEWKNFQKFQTDIWEIMPETGVEHPAPFPSKLPQTFFELHSLKEELVLDPFLGSGSSMLAARKIRRECVGYEINPEYIELIKKRCGFAAAGQSTMESYDKTLDKEDTLEVEK